MTFILIWQTPSLGGNHKLDLQLVFDGHKSLSEPSSSMVLLIQWAVCAPTEKNQRSVSRGTECSFSTQRLSCHCWPQLGGRWEMYSKGGILQCANAQPSRELEITSVWHLFSAGTRHPDPLQVTNNTIPLVVCGIYSNYKTYFWLAFLKHFLAETTGHRV